MCERDSVRRQAGTKRRRSTNERANQLKGRRYVLCHNAEHLSVQQEQKLARIATVNHKLYRAHLMTEQLRVANRTKGRGAITMLSQWLKWTSRCRIHAFVELRQMVRRHLPGIETAMQHDLLNAIVESTSTKLGLLLKLTKVDYIWVPRLRKGIPNG